MPLTAAGRRFMDDRRQETPISSNFGATETSDDSMGTHVPQKQSDQRDQPAGSRQPLAWDALSPLGSQSGHRRSSSAGDTANQPSSDSTAQQPDSSENPFLLPPDTGIGKLFNKAPPKPNHKAPTGDLSMEALYAKLLVYCQDIGVQCSCEGLLSLIRQSGIMVSDRRIALSMEKLRQFPGGPSDPLNLEHFQEIIRPNLRFMVKVLTETLVVPDFQTFSNDLAALAELASSDKSGHVANYIPPLRDADPERWGVAMCTTDGQLFAHGDTDDYFSIQSSSKPITYALAVKEMGAQHVHRWVGKEPSGQPFNAIVCLPDNRPHNCCVNVGAIMTCAVLASKHPQLSVPELVSHLMGTWSELCGHIGEVQFDHETMEAEKSTASNNFALAWFIKARRGLPEEVTLEKATDFYFSCCSIRATCRMMSVVAATLANGGVCPLTSKEVFSANIVSKVLSQMQACGMYDASGQFLFNIGLPGKSGVSGIVMTVVPNVMGVACFSPRLDTFGNSVRGVRFNQMLVNCFSLHVYDNLSAMHSGCKKDPRLSQSTAMDMELANLRFAIKHGEKAALEFRKLLLEAMACTILADGDASNDELVTLTAAYEGIMYVKTTPDDIRQMMVDACIKEEDVLKNLRRQNPDLDDIQREVILEAVFAAAAADRKLNEPEVQVLSRIADALHVPPAVVELKLFEWRDMLAGRCLEPVLEEDDDDDQSSQGRNKNLSATVMLHKMKFKNKASAEAVRQAFEAEVGQQKNVSGPRTRHRSLLRRAELARASADGSGDMPLKDRLSLDGISLNQSPDRDSMAPQQASPILSQV